MKAAEKLTRWITRKYEGRLIRRTYQPYINHLLTVAQMAAKATDFGYETGLCHDLFEDTGTTAIELKKNLTSFGYSLTAAEFITNCTIELTDVFTAGAYPDLSKKERKEREAERLVTISPAAQTVKYCDLIYNTLWVIQYDREHAEKYLNRKLQLVTSMVNGDSELQKKALQLISKSMEEL